LLTKHLPERGFSILKDEPKQITYYKYIQQNPRNSNTKVINNVVI